MTTKHAVLAAILTVACWATRSSPSADTSSESGDIERGGPRSPKSQEDPDEKERTCIDKWCGGWSACCCTSICCFLFLGIIGYAIYNVTAPPSFSYIFTERYPGMFSTDVTLPDFLCKSPGSLEKSAPELMTQAERDLCSTTHDRNMFGLGRESHVQPWLANVSEIPLNVEIDPTAGVDYLSTPEQQEAFRQHVLDVTQVAGDVIGKTYRLVDNAECQRIGTVPEWMRKGQNPHVSPCQKIRYTKSDWDGEYFRTGLYDPDYTYECRVNPQTGQNIEESPWRDEISLHEMIHSQGVSHSMIEGALMKVGGHRRGAVLSTSDTNRLTATYAKTDIAARRAAGG